MNTFLWGALPYLVFGVLVTGLFWRYRYDKFGWTTRSSEVYESRILNIASPVFHYGILSVLAGHLIGLFIPSSWTAAVGIDEHTYHLFSLLGGGLAGTLAVLGILTLIWRRRTKAPVFRATTRNDKAMYVVLVGAIVWGLTNKFIHSDFQSGYNYRTTIAPWARSLFRLEPDVSLMDHVPLGYKVHALIGMLLFAMLPFTRLVHMFSAPVQYFFRPYILYRTRDPEELTGRIPRRGWERIDR
ncbi:respiratory nitrate reductase subunit gamma [Streptomyces sp. NPDC057011]|uniref:respiratory nitrate reductase subunit gamma n=1 Tax=unclassified Streptomyces TaxID=2593676 RepID=UPI003631B876